MVDPSIELIKSFRNHEYMLPDAGDVLVKISKNLSVSQYGLINSSMYSIDHQEKIVSREGHKSRKSKKNVIGHLKKIKYPEIEKLEKTLKKITFRSPIKSKSKGKRVHSDPNVEFILANVEIDEKDKKQTIIDSQTTTEATVANSFNILGKVDNVATMATPGGGMGERCHPRQKELFQVRIYFFLLLKVL